MEDFNRTTDINIAAYLICLGYTLNDIVPAERNPKQKVFTFKEMIPKEMVNAFWDGAVIPAKLFVATIKELKTRLHQM